MELCLLDMVQDILSDMNSDEVNSINDTTESLQVAQIVKSTYFLMCSNRDWGDERGLKTLDHIGDISKPTYLTIPRNLKKMEYLAYDHAKEDQGPLKNYVKLKYRAPDQFLQICNTRPRENEHFQDVLDFGGSTFTIKTNSSPTYWTTFDDKYIVCDSYDKTQSSTLVASKTQSLVVEMPYWDMRDDFIPKLPVVAYSALLAEAKSSAFLVLRQMENAKAEMASQKQQRWLSRNNKRADVGVRYQVYGRRSQK